MAEYKVPQDVEADDKLLGPFTFRQFIYLMVMGGCIALSVALFQIFPLLIIIPAPVAIFFAVLALPLKKDQPMETYLAAIVSYHLKPKKRLWTAGQREGIVITAPKKVENPRTRDITGEEASTRLSFLANVIDTEGYAIRNDSLADVANAPDMFDNSETYNIDTMINREQDARRAAIVDQMRTAINRANEVGATGVATGGTPTGLPNANPVGEPVATGPVAPTTPVNPLNSPVVIRPNTLSNQGVQENPKTKAEMTALANDKDLSVETIAKEAKRIEKKDKEVYVSLH